MKNSVTVLADDKSGPIYSEAEMLSRTLSLGKQTYFVLDTVNDELMWPPETYRLWGLDPETNDPVTREWVLESIHPEDREKVTAVLENPDIDELNYEFRITLPDGSERHIRTNAIRDRDSTGSVIRIFGLLRDITDERRISGELRTTGRFLDLAVQSTRLGIWEVDLDIQEVIGNDQIYTLLGYKRGEISMASSTWTELCHPEDRTGRATILKKVTAGEMDAYDHEYRLKTKSGAYIWVLVNGQVVERHPDGRPSRMSGTMLDITARKEAEKEIGAQNELLSLALQMGWLGYFHYDVQPDIISWPADTYRLWGLEPDAIEPTADLIVSAVHPEDRDLFIGQIRDPSWDEMEHDFRIILPDGKTRYLRSQIIRQRGPKGEPYSSYGVYQDVSQFRQMQSALMEGEARFRSIFETSGAGIVIADYHSNIHYINNAFADLLGYDVDDLIGKEFTSLSPEGEKDPVLDHAADLRSGVRNNLSLEKRYRHRDGHVVWVRLNINAVDGLGMGEQMLVGVAQDITERREAEIRLEESSELLEEAQRLGQFGHWSWSPETDQVEWSSQIYRILGLDPSQPVLHMTPFRDYMHPDDRMKWDEMLEVVLAGEQSATMEYRLIRADGKVRTVSGRAVVEDTSSGDRRLLATVQDLTDSKQTEDALHRAIETAEAANRAKSKFLASMSHELRTPLNTILGFAQLLSLKTRGPLNEDQKGYVENIVQGGEHLLGLINDVLDLAQIDSGQLAVNIEPIDVVDIADRVLKNFQQLAAARNIRISFADHVPAKLLVNADRMRLTQVLVNLTSNAIKYNREHGKVAYMLSTTEDDYGRIGVSDTGRGIPAERRSEVFQSFNRLGAESSGEEGTGIGLTLSKSLVEQMNGRIGFTSEDDEGTLFWVDLPLTGKSANA